MGKISPIILKFISLMLCSKNRTPMRGIHNSVLEIVSADFSANGLYKCEGRNRFGVEEVTFEVNILGEYIILCVALECYSFRPPTMCPFYLLFTSISKL